MRVKLFFTKWNSSSRITVVQVNQGQEKHWIIMDGDAGTLLPDFEGDLGAWRFLQGRVLRWPTTSSPQPGR